MYHVSAAGVLVHNNCATGKGRTHITYHGWKNGKAYSGYASAPSRLGLSPEQILKRRYRNGFKNAGFDTAPKIRYSGTGVTGKRTARGLEQALYELDVKRLTKRRVANLQRPVGPRNKSRDDYLAALAEWLKTNSLL